MDEFLWHCKATDEDTLTERWYMYIENMVNKWYIKTTNLIHFYAGWSSKCYWKAIKDLMNNYKFPDSIPILKRSANGNEELCYEDVDKAYCFKDFFTSVSTVDDSNIKLSPISTGYWFIHW